MCAKARSHFMYELDVCRSGRASQAQHCGTQIFMILAYAPRELWTGFLLRNGWQQLPLLEFEMRQLVLPEELHEPRRGRLGVSLVDARQITRHDERQMVVARQWHEGGAALHLRKNTEPNHGPPLLLTLGGVGTIV
jgi:hypothetical protein